MPPPGAPRLGPRPQRRRQQPTGRWPLWVALAASAAAALRPAWAVSTLLQNLQQPQGIALDLTSGRIYWTEVDSGELKRAYLGGKEELDLQPEIVIRRNSTAVEESAYGVALDHKAGKVYWTAMTNIYRADLNGSHVEKVVNCRALRSTATCNGGLALDVQAGNMYWTSWGDSRIYRASFNGSNPEAIITEGVKLPIDIALDLTRKKVYWTDADKKTIERADLNGGTVEKTSLTIQRGDVLNMSFTLQQTNGIAIDPSQEGQIYLTGSADLSGGQSPGVYRTGLSGDNPESEVLIQSGDLQKPWGIAYDHQGNTVYWSDQELGVIQRLVLQCKPGSIEVPSSTGGESDAKVSYERMRHSKSATVECPMGYSGEVRLMCDDGVVTVSSGHCAKNCPAGELKQEANESSIAYGEMKSGESTVASCNESLVGDVRVKCLEGVVSIASGLCRPPRSCGTGSLLHGHAKIPYSGMPHKGTVSGDCPSGFEGNYTLICDDGNVTAIPGEGICEPTCDEGVIWIDDGGGLIEVSKPRMNDGGELKVPCPEDSPGQGVLLACVDEVIRVTEPEDPKERCTRRCDAGSKVIGGAQLNHSTMKEGEVQDRGCPAGFSGDVTISCTQGEVHYIGSCHARCPSGTYPDGSGAMIPYQAFHHGDELKVNCPHGFQGVVSLLCNNGNITRECNFENSSRCDCQVAVPIHEDIPPQQDSTAPGTEAGTRRPADQEEASHPDSQPAEGEDGAPSPVPDSSPTGSPSSPSSSSSSTTVRAVGGSLRGSAMPGSRRPPIVVVVAPIAGGLALAVVVALVAWRVIKYRRQKRMAACPQPALPTKAAKCIVETLGWPMGWTGSGGDSSTAEPNSVSEMNEIITDSCVPLPPYWATQEGVHIFPDPNRVNEVQQLMNDTWRVIWTRDRRLIAGDGRVPVGCRVASVLRIEHHGGYDKYWKHKADVTARHCAAGACEPFHVNTDNRLNLLDADCNEKYLFHGTNPEAAHAIARSLFRIDMAGSCRGCMFGPGIYLAENASKSDEYAKEGSGVYVGLCAMLVCRAVAGRVLNVETSGDFSDQVTNGEYDSLCGDRLAAAGTFREMVFFHEQAVYPEFIVIYARQYGDS